jgi:hypothetical protein
MGIIEKSKHKVKSKKSLKTLDFIDFPKALFLRAKKVNNTNGFESLQEKKNLLVREKREEIERS